MPAFILMTASGSSGAEKRLARTFLYLHGTDPGYHLILNDTLRDALIEQGVPLASCENVHALAQLPGLPLSNPVARKLYLPIYARQIAALVERHRVRVVHLAGSGVYIGAPLARSGRIGVVVSLYNTGLDSTVTRLTRPLFAYVLRRAHAIDALSDDIAGRLAVSRYNAGGALASRVHVMPCSFIEHDAMHPAPVKDELVVFAGRFSPVKQPILFVDALPAIRARHPGVRFAMLGQGPLEAAIRLRLAALGLADAVEVRFAPAPQDTLARSKIFLSLQVGNNYPSQSLLEAMACANAVVATDVGETHKLVDDSIGARVPPDPAAIAAAVNALLDDPARLAAAGTAARARVRAEHTVERAGEHLRALHRRVRDQVRQARGGSA